MSMHLFLTCIISTWKFWLKQLRLSFYVNIIHILTVVKEFLFSCPALFLMSADSYIYDQINIIQDILVFFVHVTATNYIRQIGK